MKNKKGDLLNNVLTTVIAVLGIALLIYGAWKLYSVYLNTDELSAKAAMNAIDGRIGNVQRGETTKLAMKGAENWFLTAWNNDDPGRPDKCYLKSCICVCKGYNTVVKYSISSNTGMIYLNEMSPLCQKDGFCRFYDDAVIHVEGFAIEGYPAPEYYEKSSTLTYLSASFGNIKSISISLPQGQKTISNNRLPLIKFSKNLIEVSISKTFGQKLTSNKEIEIIAIVASDKTAI